MSYKLKIVFLLLIIVSISIVVNAEEYKQIDCDKIPRFSKEDFIKFPNFHQEATYPYTFAQRSYQTGIKNRIINTRGDPLVTEPAYPEIPVQSSNNYIAILRHLSYNQEVREYQELLKELNKYQNVLAQAGGYPIKCRHEYGDGKVVENGHTLSLKRVYFEFNKEYPSCGFVNIKGKNWLGYDVTTTIPVPIKAGVENQIACFEDTEKKCEEPSKYKCAVISSKDIYEPRYKELDATKESVDSNGKKIIGCAGNYVCYSGRCILSSNGVSGCPPYENCKIDLTNS